MEPLDWEELDDKTNDELKGTDNNTEDVLIGVQSLRFDNLSSEFNHEHLDDDGEDSDVDEKWVSEHATEDVQFLFELSSIELVENLHENESLEDVGEVDELLGTKSSWLLRWEVLLLLNAFIIKEIVITFEFLLLIFLLLDVSMELIFFNGGVEVANEVGEHFLVEIINSKIMIVNLLFLPPVNVELSGIVILSIEWVELDAFGDIALREFKAWNIVWFAEDALAQEDDQGNDN